MSNRILLEPHNPADYGPSTSIVQCPKSLGPTDYGPSISILEEPKCLNPADC